MSSIIIMIVVRKVGRPEKYPTNEKRSEIRRKQNRENQRKCRMRKKLLEDVMTISYNSLKNYNKSLSNYFNQFEFDTFFTGTFDYNKIQRQEIEKQNNEIIELNKEFNLENSLVTDKHISIQSLRKYTEKYLNVLYQKDLFIRCFVVFEKGKNNKNHVHILFKSNNKKINFINTTENFWLIGNSISVIIETKEDQLNLIGYCLKELKPLSTSITDQSKVDNWFLLGNFEQNEVNSKKSNLLMFKPELEKVIFPVS